jgi:hypothetical protein
MDMKTWILASATVLVAVAGLAHGAEPWSSPPNRGSPAPARTKVFPTAHAWVNSMRQEAAAPAPAEPALRPAIVGNGNIGQSGNERAVVGNGFEHGAMIAATAWNGEHQYTGYVYSPGACDHTPPCVNHLWDGYCQNPCRCRPHGHHFHRGCGHHMGCSTCNSGCNMGGCHGCRLHGLRHFGGSSCGCETACNTCDTGCGHRHGCGLFSGKHRGWFASLCASCDGGMSCGCAAPIGGDALPSNAEPIPTPATDDKMPPLPPQDDDAKSARRNTINRYLPWSIK